MPVGPLGTLRLHLGETARKLGAKLVSFVPVLVPPKKLGERRLNLHEDGEAHPRVRHHQAKGVCVAPGLLGRMPLLVHYRYFERLADILLVPYDLWAQDAALP